MVYHCNNQHFDEWHCAEARFSQCLGCAKYQRGEYEPNYPVPATMDTAILSVLHQWEYNLKWLIPLKLREIQQR